MTIQGFKHWSIHITYVSRIKAQQEKESERKKERERENERERKNERKVRFWSIFISRGRTTFLV